MSPAAPHGHPPRYALRRILAGALLAAALGTASPVRAQAPDFLVARFDSALAELGDGSEDGPTARRFRTLWSLLDGVVLGVLNVGRASALHTVLAGLHGYEGPRPGDGVQVGRTTFHGQLPREVPNYFAAPFRLGKGDYVLGTYSLGINSPGRLSVYRQVGRRWTQLARMDTETPAAAYLLPLGENTLGVVTVETFAGGDRQEGTIRLWRLAPDGLRPQHAERGRYVDPEVAATDSTLAVSYASFPIHLQAPVLGTRLTFTSTYRARGGRLVADTVSTNPWVEVLDRFHGYLKNGRSARARELVAGDSLFRLLARTEPAVWEDDGDLARGEGHVTFAAGASGLRVESRRDADGRWRIVRALPTPCAGTRE